jgi:hypothetical protein
MVSASPRERLSRLVELAAESSIAARRELTEELADLLLDWPSAYPEAMREPFEALLEKSVTDIEPEARTLLARRFAERESTPLSILNALIFDAPPEIRAVILARNAEAAATEPADSDCMSESVLLSEIRQAQLEEISRKLGSCFHISAAVAERIVDDASALSLVGLCKGGGLSRAAFSALAILARPFAKDDERYRRLAAYDTVSDDAARALLSFWRRQAAQAQPTTQAA